MSQKSDWLPSARDAVLARAWLVVLAAKFQAWGVVQSTMQSFSAMVTDAETALTTAKNETTRTSVATARCKEAFDAMVTDADYVSLGLKSCDATQTPSGKPTA
ncbi:MAG: hypothetical protein LBE74_02790 [Treponema sp.]|jgi:hypothetical protein|nr:hypothetical protein [Treponema sp.]